MPTPDRDRDPGDRSWTVAPVLLWFAGFLIVALFLFDGGVQALADRFTAEREPSPRPAAGPVFAAKPVEVAEADEADSSDGDDAAAVAAPAAPTAEGKKPVALHRDKILVLEDFCLDGTPESCKRWAMDNFYRALGQAKAKKLGHPLRVSWYGDSVIATDAIPNHLRTLLQAQLGDGGPGYVYLAPPHRFCSHEAVTRTNTGNWLAHAISTTPIADGLYGVGGSSAETDGGRAVFKLVAGTASQLDLYYLTQPRGGSVAITADGKPLTTVDTKGAAKAGGFASASVEGGAQKFELVTTGKVRGFGVDLENTSGAVVDNLGIVSVSLRSLRTNNPDAFQAALAHRAADLVIIMIGANEATWLGPGDHDTKDYPAQYEKLLDLVRAARPDGACLVISAMDQAERDGSFASRPVMPVLVEAQHKAAKAAGCGFYSAYDWMGGKGAAAKWFRKGLVGSDLVHLTPKGANRFVESLHATLMAGYDKYAAP